MPHHFSETVNGFPYINVVPPYELVGEILRCVQTASRVNELLTLTDDVISGRSSVATHDQDYAQVSFNGATKNAHIWFDDLSLGKEVECDITLDSFREITADWLDYLKKREELRMQN